MQPTNLQSEYVKDETTTTTMILNEGESELGKNPSPRWDLNPRPSVI